VTERSKSSNAAQLITVVADQLQWWQTPLICRQSSPVKHSNYRSRLDITKKSFRYTLQSTLSLNLQDCHYCCNGM